VAVLVSEKPERLSEVVLSGPQAAIKVRAVQTLRVE
jgi:hypothetical protein